MAFIDLKSKIDSDSISYSNSNPNKILKQIKFFWDWIK